MGRKKRKLVETEAPPSETEVSVKVESSDAPSASATPVQTTTATVSKPAAAVIVEQESSNNGAVKQEEDDKNSTAPAAASGYAMTSHSGDIVTEDIYVSDGSEDDDDVPLDQQPELLLGGSRMGVMRRGVGAIRGALVQPNRQWARPSKDGQGAGGDGGDGDGNNEDEQQQQQQQAEEDELEKLDPAQRAARLLQEKQRKLEEAKIMARRLESEENAGRDPCLFSKRTAFDIRMDQIEDKPWTRGGEITDFFNYGLAEEDWLEYSSHQLAIRKELNEASQQKRPPDPTVVPVIPKTPTKQAPRVAVRSNSSGSLTGDVSDENGETETLNEDGDIVVGPTRSAGEDNAPADKKSGEGKDSNASGDVKHVGAGGAWGAGAAPGSLLAKLIEERDKKEAAKQGDASSTDQPDDSSLPKRGHDGNAFPERGYGSRGPPTQEGYHHHRGGGDFHHGEPPPPQYEHPPRPREYGRGYGGGGFGGYGGGRGRGGYGGRGRGGYHDQGGRGRGWGGRGGYDPRGRGGRGDYGGRRY